MKVKVDENVLVCSNNTHDLNKVLDNLAAKDSQKVAAFLVEKASLPRELRMWALRLVLNDYIKMAKELVLSDEFMYRLNWYEKFSEYQLVNFWNILVTSNANVFNEEKEVIRFKKAFYLLLLKNASTVEFSDTDLDELRAIKSSATSIESFKEFLSESDAAFYDYECNFDGMSYEDFKTTLKKCSTVADIRNIAAKYDINVPKRLKKEELVALVLEGLRRQGKADENTEAQLKKMSAITLQRHAKVNGVKASTEMKKDDIIEFIMNRIESSKVVQKPRVELESLPELLEFKFSKDYLREVNIVDDEDDNDEPVVEPAPVVEEAAPVVEEPVVEEVVEEAPVVEEVAPVVEEPVVEEVVEEEPVVEEVVVTNVYNDELLQTLVRLLEEKEQKEAAEDARFNAMVELYEKRIAHLEETLKEIRNTPVPININIAYPTEDCEELVQVSAEQVVEPAEEVMEEVTPVVYDSTFDSMTEAEKAKAADQEMVACKKVDLSSDDHKVKKIEEKKVKIEKIRAKNDKATFKKARRRRIRKIIGWIITLVILLAVALFTLTTLIDLAVIKGSFAEKFDSIVGKVLPFMGPEGVVRNGFTWFIVKIVDFVKSLFA